ncbi:hypothetical protein L3073_05995 [Ancylomarina sp. DW003]|nr:hypothetical protein [Ancylomarina sp. DW003]MDE5421752.1 hypothetical protein [Ancylomarina sp. DW003]
MNEPVTASNVETKTQTRTFSWTLTAYENRGNLWLKWETTAPFRAQQDKIEVYEKGWPSNPDSNSKAWTWADSKKSPWDTGLRWGSNWHCARIAQSAPNGPYVFVEKFIL